MFNSIQSSQTGISFGSVKYDINKKMLKSFINSLDFDPRRKEELNKVIPKRVYDLLDTFTRNSGENEGLVKIEKLSISYPSPRQSALNVLASCNGKMVSVDSAHANRLDSMTTPFSIAPLLEQALNSRAIQDSVAAPKVFCA